MQRSRSSTLTTPNKIHSFVWCHRKLARAVCEREHYMHTYPQGAALNIAMCDEQKRAVGIAVFGYSTGTHKRVVKIAHSLEPWEYLEMQRLWISDDYGHNTESAALGHIMRAMLKPRGVRLVVTYAGGCKNDCGIVYQASAWLYFGRDPCNDFYLTASGEYKNMAAALRFGRVSAKGKTPQQVGEELFGAGEVVESFRYFYAYPIDKGIRRRLSKVAEPYPKTSRMYRRDQQWVQPDE